METRHDPSITQLVPEMVARYTSGQSARTIAKRLGMAQDTVFARLRLAGVTVRPVGFTRVSKETRAEAVRLYTSGVPSTKVAEKLGVARTSVVEWVRKAGLVVRERTVRGPATSEDVIADAVRRYASGESSLTVAHSLKVSRHSVLAWVRKAGGTVRSRAHG